MQLGADIIAMQEVRLSKMVEAAAIAYAKLKAYKLLCGKPTGYEHRNGTKKKGGPR